MAEYHLYCFAQSGNCYRAALDAQRHRRGLGAVYVDFFKAGVQRTRTTARTSTRWAKRRCSAHGSKKLSQSGVILLYLAERSGKFLPRGEDERLEALRWIIFDNQKVGGNLGPYRFVRNFAKPVGEPAVLEFLKARVARRAGHSR